MVNVCSEATGKLIAANDHASVQIQFAMVNKQGIMTGERQGIVLSGAVRKMGAADESVNRLAGEMGLISTTMNNMSDALIK